MSAAGLDVEEPAVPGSWVGVAQFVTDTVEAALLMMLRQVAHLAVDVTTGADGAGVTLFEPDRADTIVATSDFVRATDAIQYGLGQGPCIAAAMTGRTVRAPSLGTDPRWPNFGAQVARLGVHSALSLPLHGPERVLGSINLYAYARDAFTDSATGLAQQFAVSAAPTVHNAHTLIKAQRRARQASRG